MRRGRLAIPLVCVVLAGCASGGATTTGAHGRPGTRTAAIGRPLAPRPVEVMGIRGSLELSVADPSLPSGPSLYLTLGRSVRREPRDVCFGSYAGNESPEDGDASCQVRGGQPLILTLSEHAIPYSWPVRRFAAVWGQVGVDVARVLLIGPGGARAVLPLSAHRMFLIAFAPSARGPYQLVIRRTNAPRSCTALRCRSPPGRPALGRALPGAVRCSATRRSARTSSPRPTGRSSSGSARR